MSSAIKRNALGKGLGALLSDNEIVNPKSTGLPPIVSANANNSSIDTISIELIETKLKQLQAKVNVYRSLGGGWN